MKDFIIIPGKVPGRIQKQKPQDHRTYRQPCGFTFYRFLLGTAHAVAPAPLPRDYFSGGRVSRRLKVSLKNTPCCCRSSSIYSMNRCERSRARTRNKTAHPPSCSQGVHSHRPRKHDYPRASLQPLRQHLPAKC